MKKKIFSILLAVMFLFAGALSIVGCDNKPNNSNNNNNNNNNSTDVISLNLPTNIWITFTKYYETFVFVKIGDNYYIYNHETEQPYAVFMKDNLPSQFPDADEEQHFRAYTYYDYSWHAAEDWETNKSLVNDKLNHWLYGIYKMLTFGYDSINMSIPGYSSGTHQVENETITVDGKQIECVVFEYLNDDEDFYSHNKYWYDKDTKILLKYATSLDREEDFDNIDSGYSITKYETENLDWETVLETYYLTTSGLGL